MPSAIEIAGVTIKPGSRQSVDIQLPNFYTHSKVNMPVHVIRGRKPGPVLLVSAAIHGDEITGVEIVRRLLTSKSIDRLQGTFIAIPVVNVFGFVSKSRYLPDRRDLNRSFPGSETGSIASRLANVLMKQIIPHCTHIIDLHSGAVDRENLPQIRAKLTNEPEIEEMARAFSVPVILDANLL
jgi:predicted deacylase